MDEEWGEYRQHIELVPRAHRNLSLPNNEFNIIGLHTYYGLESIDSIKQGLSRKVEASEEDLKLLILQWKTRDLECAYRGSASDLLKETDAAFFAISYRHDNKTRWSREGMGKVCKMKEWDEELFVKSALVLCRKLKKTKAIIWCDQIISTRFKHEKNDFQWYTNGLLPYTGMPTVFLSNHVPAQELESRIWIRAERSLSRLCRGSLITGDDISTWRFEPGRMADPDEALVILSQNILSGLWPADHGYWNDDYRQLKKWALWISCKQRIFPQQLHNTLTEIDNMRIISSMRIIAVQPEAAEIEPAFWTKDSKFFLKSYAWNLHVSSEWNSDPCYVSHYTGMINPGCDFTWWSALNFALIFGVLVNENECVTVLGIRESIGYRVFRGTGNPQEYDHGQRIPHRLVLNMIQKAKGEYNIPILYMQDWKMIYAQSDWNIPNIIPPLRYIFVDAWDKNIIQAECILPSVYHRMTKKLLSNTNSEQSPFVAIEGAVDLLSQLTNKWNEFILSNFDQHVKVCDCHNGPVWLEGISKNYVTFGYLPYVTESLILDEDVLNFSKIKLPEKWRAIEYIKNVAREFPNDRQKFVTALFSGASRENCERFLSEWDLSRLILSGGFSSHFHLRQFSAFLSICAQKQGYWSTRAVCRMGKVQVRFFNGREVRILQWSSNLDDFTSIGLVNPEDYHTVETIAEVLPEWQDVPEYGTPYVHTTFMKPNIAETISREECIAIMPASSRIQEDGSSLFLVDMVSTFGENSVAPNNIIIEGDKGALITNSESRLARMVSGITSVLFLNVIRRLNQVSWVLEWIASKWRSLLGNFDFERNY